jgi:hypothetical protein
MNKIEAVDLEIVALLHRKRVLQGMQSETFREIFGDEFTNLSKAISAGDWQEVTDTIEALEACAVDACEKYDEAYAKTITTK